MIVEKRFDVYCKRLAIEIAEKWEEFIPSIPFIKFPPEWEVQVIPHFGGAIARFRIKKPNHDGEVSVYLDAFDRLGCYGRPYWEVYPLDGDVGRCVMEDTEKLIQMIKDSKYDY